jgi:hypothetical protein
MSTMTLRRRMTLTLLALGTALAGACGSSETPGPGPAVPTTTEPDVVADPPEESGFTFPNTAEEYARTVLQAWAGDDPDWIQALTTEAVYYGIFDLNASPYVEWTLLRCDGTAGSSYCSFTNPDGDLLTLRISHQALGQAHAATEVTLELTQYPNESIAYVTEFVKAWQFGNTARMLKLSSPAVVNKVPATAPTSVTYLPLECCGGGLAQVRVKIGNPTARFDVGTTKLGGPNAILDYAVGFGLSG